MWGFGLIIGWLALFVLRLGYRLLMLLICIGMVVGVWRNLKALPPLPPIAETGFNYFIEFSFATCGYVVDYVADNWLPLAIGVIFWCAITSKMMLSDVGERVSSTLRAAVASSTYFNLGIETDAMKGLKEVGAWQLMKNGLKQRLLFWLLGIGPLIDEYSTKPVRNGGPITFDDDVRARLAESEKRIGASLWQSRRDDA